MTWISRSVTAVGLLLLSHACYSAQEHSTLQSFGATSSLSATNPGTSLPADIVIETIVATLLVCLGIITGASNFRPIQWRVWAGKIEREGEVGFLNGSGVSDNDYVGNPFRILESRPGFVDIRKERREFAKWIKDGDKSSTS
ncbi:hypothetical protein D7B24_006355 [Verticillium nonalfalfae]|uniref:Transmembrane protein 32 n=1 Tax=Verticillium nonalfalfae TaxID=1051616 RepID=A0A3M9Y9K4_9PEZI|nr:uncharacterized protein D7B24_006355 [Verticillium nonalfalfae]RNJ57197.1 hypothetical protein D7B24_006355 [Verticillium nonalfalfae]